MFPRICLEMTDQRIDFLSRSVVAVSTSLGREDVERKLSKSRDVVDFLDDPR